MMRGEGEHEVMGRGGEPTDDAPGEKRQRGRH